MRQTFLFLSFILFLSTPILAQKDSLIFKNGNFIVGEVKSLDKGVLIIETDYSENDFKIEWSGIKEIYSETSFLITLTDGRRFNGTLTTTESGKIKIMDAGSPNIEVSENELVFLKAVDSGFWSQLYASVDLGFSYTKANNLRQMNMRSNLGYLAERWSLDLSFSSVNSTQDEVDPINRVDGGLTYRYFLPKDWYALANISFLSNTEQKLDLRTNGKSGLGKYVLHTNQSTWGFQLGLSFNNEKFSTETENKQSLEGYFGTQLNLFDMGDLSLLAQANAYPSITEKKRWRADFNFDAKYDLPLDFYIRLGWNFNFDNQPVEGAASSDYVFQTSVGWEL